MGIRDRARGIVLFIIVAFILIGSGKAERILAAGPVTMDENMVIYVGEERYLDIKNMGGAASVKVSTSDKKVVATNSQGKIKGVSEGKAVVTVQLQLGRKKCAVKINVRVGGANLGRSKKLNGESEPDEDNDKMPVLCFHKVLTIGESTNISFSNIDFYNADIEFESADEEVARVARNGRITAVDKGKTTVTARVTQNKKTYVFKQIIHVVEKAAKSSVDETDINKFFSETGFVGSSICVGLKNYFNSKGKDFLGGPVMMVKGCYSFMNDASSSNTYKVQYNGVPYKAKDAIYHSGVKNVFIQMGTNDLWEKPDSAYNRYVSYLKGIHERNPNVRIFIESTTPVHTPQNSLLTNSNVDRLNSLMAAYCKGKKDMYYVDINTNMKDASGKLKTEFTSDSFVHLTGKAYDSWTNDIKKYVKKLLIAEEKAEKAVMTAENCHTSTSYKKAVKLVNKLQKSSVKSLLKKRLSDVKKYL